MKVRNCKECGKLFQYDGISKLCYRCRKKDDEDFRKVKEYLYENPKETITVVSEETQVPEDKILRYLREGKLEIVGENPGILLDCESCGKSIRTGRYCEQCARALERGFKGDGEREKERKPQERSTRERMHIAQMKNKRK
ncbi:MerR family transcriptional regulator [Maledivibacter halophilus]|uniref:Flagellar operon protein TIGR03826 n=1 Tax=Maledivibacter halophilus TaxID=36842 RepID=A0A1T5JWY6_9FIRM|nr:MerR family transcriptional regulator [Maledivibacter halophilus]SKC55925.1 flagellar operon protein TIGR03826 [Maledivibacter halophilus]